MGEIILISLFAVGGLGYWAGYCIGKFNGQFDGARWARQEMDKAKGTAKEQS
jgi:hypothetical protein